MATTEEYIRPIKEIYVTKEDEDIICKLQKLDLNTYIKKKIDEIEVDLAFLCSEFRNRFDKKEWILLNDVCYIPEINGIIPDLRDCSFSKYEVEKGILKFEGFIGDYLTQEEAEILIKSENKPENNYSYKLPNGKITCSGKDYTGLYCSDIGVLPTDEKYSYDDNSILTISVHHLYEGRVDISTPEVLLFWLKNKLRPKKFESHKTEDIYNKLRILYKINKNWFKPENNDIVFINKDEVVNYFLEHSKQKFDFLPDVERIITGEIVTADDDFVEAFKEKMLNCDYERAGLPRLSDEKLTGINSGHWDLWDYNTLREKDCIKKIALPDEHYFRARDPYKDMQENEGKTLAIDFGTKSTVVGYLDKGQFVPIEISNKSNDDGNGVDPYENPSVMHFVDLQKFQEDYNKKVGRPDTKFKDIQVSHEAQNAISLENFDSFLNDLKSWCSNLDKKYGKYILKDEKGYEHTFPAYLDLKDDEADPLEYYAYYLGLYINNMSKGTIFKNYRMSFPVTYKRELRNKIMKSFGKGITKSLPTALVNNKGFNLKINKFNINSIDNESNIESIIEPAAYAITALKKYHFDEKLEELEDDGIENPEFSYAVFDFGGGTTDFDFGIYSFTDVKPYDYKIVHFGQGGVRELGGEKLLKYLAFEIFKLNVKRLHTEEGIDIKFTRYDGCSDYECVGFEDYILKDSTVANSNMFNLMEKLRWVWEKPNDTEREDYEDINTGNFTIDLLDPNGVKYDRLVEFVNTVNTTVDDSGEDTISVPITLQGLQNLLRKKIEAGVESFFNSMVSAFGSYDKDYLKDKDEISIFFAGNSTKSILFNQILSEYLGDDYNLPKCYIKILEQLKNSEIDIKASEEEIEKKVAFIEDIKEKLGNKSLRFVVYPPLRTEAGKEKLKEMGYDVNIKDNTEPSGKTGVAYGMLIKNKIKDEDGLKEKAQRKSNADDIDVLFQFYVTTEKRGKLKNIAIKKNTGLREWNKLCDVVSEETEYEFYFTSNDEAYGGKMSKDKATPYPIVIDDPKDNTFIFVRAVAQDTIEWQVADSIENLQEVEHPNLIQLKER